MWVGPTIEYSEVFFHPMMTREQSQERPGQGQQTGAWTRFK